MDNKQIRIALAGNPNSGKTTLFNKLTGSNQFVGNWPGVTVEKKEGKLIVDKEVILTDLPGIYSLSPYTLEEVVARNYLIEEKPPHRGEARRHFEHRGRDQPGAQFVPHHPAHGAGHPRGHRPQHDGPGEEGGGQHQREGTLPAAGLQDRGDFRPQGRRGQGSGARRHRDRQERQDHPPAQLLRPGGARPRAHRGGHRRSSSAGTPSRSSSGTRRSWTS